MIKYSDMLEEVLTLYPEEISCEDAHPIGKEGFYWENLHDIYDTIEAEHNYFEDTNELIGVLLWSALVGIVDGLKKKLLKGDKVSKTVNIRKIMEYNTTKEHFIDSIENTEEWQDYLKEKGETIVFD